jgi:hypothetical protein
VIITLVRVQCLEISQTQGFGNWIFSIIMYVLNPVCKKEVVNVTDSNCLLFLTEPTDKKDFPSYTRWQNNSSIRNVVFEKGKNSEYCPI